MACSKSDCSTEVGRPVEGPPALDVDDDERKLGHAGVAEGFGLEGETGAG